MKKLIWLRALISTARLREILIEYFGGDKFAFIDYK